MALPDVTALDGSLAPVEAAFDVRVPRVLAVVSPTHPACIRGVRALRDVLSEQPARDLRVLLAWTPALQTDIRDRLTKATMRLTDDRARHFLDPERLVGREVADSLVGADAVAWRTYLCYDRDATWATLGEPTDWFHGLDDCEAMPDARYRGDPAPALRTILEDL